MPELINITFYPHNDYLSFAKEFYEKYNMTDIIMPSDPRYDINKLKPKKERVCRFCGSSMPKVKFPDEAHLISELIGNKDLFSDFECKNCNHEFGKYENDLANFLGIARTILGVNAKGGIPNFKSKGKHLIARSKSFVGNNIIIIAREDIEKGIIKHDLQAGTITISYIKNPFSPLKVYKTLLKWALSVLSEEDVNIDYRYAIGYLQGEGILKGCKITGYKLPFQYNFLPRVYLFKKRNANDKIHTHVMAVYFQNEMISFPIPLNKNDFSFYNELIIPPVFPPLFNQYEPGEGITLFPISYDLSDEEKIRDAQEDIVIGLNAESLKNTVAYDSVNDKFYDKEFNPGPTKYIIIFRKGVTVDPKELMTFIREVMEK